MKYFNVIIILSLIYINFGREYVPSIINKKKDFINGILIGILSFKLFGSNLRVFNCLLLILIKFIIINLNNIL